MRWVRPCHKCKVLVPSSLVPVLLPVVGRMATKPVSLAAEKPLISKIICFTCFIHYSSQLSYVFKANSFLSFPTSEAQLTHPGGCPPPWWPPRWDGVQQLLPAACLLCCYFYAAQLWRAVSSVLCTTASALWLSCNLWACVSFELLKIIPIRGVCSGSSCSRQQGQWELVLGAELGCRCLRSGLLWTGDFNFPSKYWDFPPHLQVIWDQPALGCAAMGERRGRKWGFVRLPLPIPLETGSKPHAEFQ